MMLIEVIEKILKQQRESARNAVSDESIARMMAMMHGGDPKAKRLVGDLLFQFGKRGLTGEAGLALFAGLHSIGFHGQALVKAFEASEYNFERTYLKGMFALIRSEFPFIELPEELRSEPSESETV